jgi:hypothetical protein
MACETAREQVAPRQLARGELKTAMELLKLGVISIETASHEQGMRRTDSSDIHPAHRP